MLDQLTLLPPMLRVAYIQIDKISHLNIRPPLISTSFAVISVLKLLFFNLFLNCIYFYLKMFEGEIVLIRQQYV